MKRGKTPNRYSLKKIDSLNEELPERIKLIERCGGQPEFYMQVYRRNDGTKHEYTGYVVSAAYASCVATCW
jgi:hypothetical protein